MHRRIIAAALWLLCALAPLVAQAQGGLRLSGALLYTEKEALPQHALMVVQLQTLDGRPFTTIRRPTRGAQVPLPFAIQGPANAPFALRAALFAAGRAVWASPQIVIQPGHGHKILPPVILNRIEATSFAQHFLCGQMPVAVTIAGGVARMRAGSTSYDLRAEGAGRQPRYVATGSGEGQDTWFRARGNRARVRLNGKLLPECLPQIAPMLFALHAKGVKPDWRLDLAAGRLRFTPSGGEVIRAPIPLPQVGLDELRFELPGGRLVAVLSREICHDGATPLPFPIRAEVTVNGQSYQGCAGTPAQVLEGAPWKVLNAAGTDLSQSGTEMRFLANQVSGMAPCNRYSARMLFDTGMHFGPLAATRNTCPALAMNKEQAFFNALGAADGFEIKDGRLHLLARGQTVLEATR